jgi:hypothetical protein
MTTATTDSNDASATGETYTHAAWQMWAETCMDKLQGLWESLDAMAAQIGADDGDQAQIEAIQAWQAEIEGVIAAGHQMVAEVNATQVPVGESVAAAGGSVNTPHKQYADEARSA